MLLNKKYSEYIGKLKKNELVEVVNYFHKLCVINNYEVASAITKEKKKNIVDYLVDMHDKYIEFLIGSLDLKDWKEVKRIVKKTSILGVDNLLVEYLTKRRVLFDGELAMETLTILRKLLKNKKIATKVKKNNRLYKIADGMILAYGVIDKDTFKNVIKEENIDLIEIYYKKEYVIDNKKIVSTKLSNKKKINSYLENKKVKEFSVNEFYQLGCNKYHYKIKSYKKLIRILKKNYIFKNHDIIFVDDMIITPYLYKSLAEEELAYKELEKAISEYFEFNDSKLKNVLLENITKIRKEFPVWEHRGFSSIEVK